MNIFIPSWFAGYSVTAKTVSELSTINAPTREIWVMLGSIYTLLITAFGWGVWKSATDSRRLRIIGGLIFTYGIVRLIWPLAPMHQREVLEAGGESMTDTMHLVLAAVTVILMTLAIVFGAMALGKEFSFYSILSLLILLFFGVLTSLDAPGMKANLPTPWAGIWEHINIGVFLLWVIVLALILLREKKSTPLISAIRNDLLREKLNTNVHS